MSVTMSFDLHNDLITSGHILISDGSRGTVVSQEGDVTCPRCHGRVGSAHGDGPAWHMMGLPAETGSSAFCLLMSLALYLK